MGYAEAAAIIDAPLEAVWEALNDIDHTPEWVVGLERAEIVTPGIYGLGSVYNDYNRIGSALQVTAWTVTLFEPKHRQVHESQSAVLPSKMTLTLSPLAGGQTRLIMDVSYRFLPQLGFISRAFERLVMNRVLAGVIHQNQVNLDRYLQRTVFPSVVAASAAMLSME